MKSWFNIAKTVLMATVITFVTSPLFLMAQQAEEKTEAKSSPWVMPYMLFTLAIFLGVAVVCLPTKRAEKPKLED